jgi:hypothetical protein
MRTDPDKGSKESNPIEVLDVYADANKIPSPMRYFWLLLTLLLNSYVC